MPPKRPTEPARARRGRGRGASRAIPTVTDSPPEIFPDISPTPSDNDEIETTRENDNDRHLPPAVAAASPMKRRRGPNQPGINKLSDVDAWELEDKVLIGKITSKFSI